MRKFLFFTSVLLIFTLAVKSQSSLTSVTRRPALVTRGHVAPNGICDTLNLFSVNNQQGYFWAIGSRGSCFGISELQGNDARILQSSNRFDVSGSQYQYVKGGVVFFKFANSNVAANMSKNITFKLYDEANTNTP